MNVKSFAHKAGFAIVTMPQSEKEISNVYIGDLLSWVMGRSEGGDVWITIMSNINILAVASLTDAACILLAENVAVADEVIKTAEEKGVNILSTPLSSYDAAKRIAEIIG